MQNLSREDKIFFLRALHPITSNSINSGTVVAVGAGVSTMIAEQNSFRHVLTVMNFDAVNDLYLNKSNNAAVQGTGIVLRPGGVFSCGFGTDDGYTGRVFGISVAATNVGVTETSINIDEILKD